MQLSAWASQASLDFAAEIMDASRWPEDRLRGRSCQQSREVGRQDC